jgi:hypothetical protein
VAPPGTTVGALCTALCWLAAVQELQIITSGEGEPLLAGVIPHVPDLRARLPRRLIVEPAEPGGRGSRVHIEGS